MGLQGTEHSKFFHTELKIDKKRKKKRVAQNVLGKIITAFDVSRKARCLSGKHVSLFGHTKSFELKALYHE